MPLRLLVGEASSAILYALDDDDALMVVLGTGGLRGLGGPVGPVCPDVLAHASKAVIEVPSPVVPKREQPTAAGGAKVVVPLVGDGAAAGRLGEMLGGLSDRGMEVVPVHVGTATNSPWYWDHFYYDFSAWHRRLWQGGCPFATRPLELRHGAVVPGVDLLDVAIFEMATEGIAGPQSHLRLVASLTSGSCCRPLTVVTTTFAGGADHYHSL